MYKNCPDASVVHASGSGQLQANPHVARPWLSPGKPTQRAVSTMGSNDLVVGEDYMLGPSCQRYDWQTAGEKAEGLNFFSTWILPLHVVSSTLRRNSSSYAVDAHQRRRRRRFTRMYTHILFSIHKWVHIGTSCLPLKPDSYFCRLCQ